VKALEPVTKLVARLGAAGRQIAALDVAAEALHGKRAAATLHGVQEVGVANNAVDRPWIQLTLTNGNVEPLRILVHKANRAMHKRGSSLAPLSKYGRWCE